MTRSTSDPGISSAEHEVMEILWQRSPLSATEVASRIPASRDWSLPTVKTLLARLVAKQAVSTTAKGKAFLYTPMIARDAWVGGQSRALVDRLFGGRLSPLVAQFAQAGEISDKDRAEIEALLRALKR